MRVGVAQEVPRRVDEGVHRVRLATPFNAATRTRNADPVLGSLERRLAFRRVVVDLGKQDRKLVFGHRDDSAGGAMHDGNRGAPITLARDQPVAKAIADGRTSEPALPEPVDDRARSLRG